MQSLHGQVRGCLIRHFSVAPYITICPSTETFFGLYLRGVMSAVTGIYLFRLLLNIIFFALRSFLPQQTVHTLMECRMMKQEISLKKIFGGSEILTV